MACKCGQECGWLGSARSTAEQVAMSACAFGAGQARAGQADVRMDGPWWPPCWSPMLELRDMPCFDPFLLLFCWSRFFFSRTDFS